LNSVVIEKEEDISTADGDDFAHVYYDEPYEALCGAIIIFDEERPDLPDCPDCAVVDRLNHSFY